MLERKTKCALLVAALELLSGLVGESLDIAERDGGELRGEELGGEVVIGVEGIDIDETVIDSCHFCCKSSKLELFGDVGIGRRGGSAQRRGRCCGKLGHLARQRMVPGNGASSIASAKELPSRAP